ncbi:MAG: XRE family transcriptional regulator [Oscillospiraceae bacterium]|nr:XRE family transcriptional regulator [Oscillospiraceae bacterium]
MMMFSERLKAKRKERGLTQAELARRIGVGRDLYNKYERTGTRPSHETLVLLAAELNTTIDYLLMGEADAVLTTHEKTKFEKIVSKLPLYNVPVSAGDGQWLAEGNDYEHYDFEDAPKNADFALKVRGDSMEPMYFNDDIVFVKTCVQVESGQFGVFFLNGEGYLKMLQGNRLISLNDEYEPITIGEYDTFFTCGRIIGKAKG